MTRDSSPRRPEDLSLRIGGSALLVPLDPLGALSKLADLAAAASEAGCPRLAAFLRETSGDLGRLGAALDLSPHLRSVLNRRPEWLERLFDEDAGERIEAIVEEVTRLPGAEMTEGGLMAALRLAKAEVALLVALRDLFGAADVRRTTADLSDLAEAAVRAALRFCLSDLGRRGALTLGDPTDPEAGCGLFVLGMGKLGGRELNYSSDIDLIVLFDPDRLAMAEPDEAVDVFSKLARRLVRLLSERTRDGYVFRTDLRLRPDPGAMPLAIPVPAAVTYYEASGRNWERAAMIKARCIAGDALAGQAFLDEMTPFVWRKYLDFAAIAEIQSMKDRIDRHRGFEGIGIAGHNVKLGPGGIREVEFFAQTQQLIAGGRTPSLRLRRTEEALRELVAVGWVASETAEELIEAYWFLRRVEHAIQMLADEQSHTLPEDEDGLGRVARLSGFLDTQSFSDALMGRMTTVEQRFSDLFATRSEPDDTLPKVGGFLGGEGATGVAAYLSTLGFQRPGDVARILQGWGAGRHRATRAEATRRHLARVLPQLLAAFARAKDPDAAFAAFDRFVEQLPAGLQFFSLISSNPKILDLLALIISASPRLSATILKRPHVFDALLDPAFYAQMPSRDVMTERLGAFLSDADGYEDVLSRLRLFASEQQFLVGARLLSGAIEGEEAGRGFSDIADVVLVAAVDAVGRTFAAAHGTVPGGRLVLLGMGRLGSRELTAGSDIDLILLYDHDHGAEDSDGQRPLAASLYFSRLTQRLIAALSAPMGEGVLYEVDFRLRPSGNKGPLATHLSAFRRYQALEARTWERMALTRSRVVAGDASLAREAEAAVRDAIGGSRNGKAVGADVAADVAAMRALIEREKPARGPLDLKLRPGGIIDLEFLAQWAILDGAVGPEFIGAPTLDVLSAMDASPDLRNRHLEVTLGSSMRVYTKVIQLTRLGHGGVYSLGTLPHGLAARIARALGLSGSAEIEPLVETTAARVREAFARLLPATPGPEG
ncbi:MAG: bifunctional [glutamine synthetase] adenylyltransferase/[glutamine synthetase]-adenylyl-L-tyrosine phosphorylase [Rhizobiaceae bacterium]|nr:bifunctional [glutamine synthetase] adenylyltransferase/[glutamine synthetase]-adenylyl-L-tyrosine phosphorylase [Rhizobiaceae bacterium]